MNNILWEPSADSRNGVRGFLIDLDYAIDIRRLKNSGALHRTGTLLYMAINVLKAKPHNYIHDLESFLYILVHLGICYDTDDKDRIIDRKEFLDPNINPVERWLKGSYSQMADAKTGSINDFEATLELFSPGMAKIMDLARSVKEQIFFLGPVYRELPEEAAVVYERVFECFDNYLDQEETDLVN